MPPGKEKGRAGVAEETQEASAWVRFVKGTDAHGRIPPSDFWTSRPVHRQHVKESKLIRACCTLFSNRNDLTDRRGSSVLSPPVPFWSEGSAPDRQLFSSLAVLAHQDAYLLTGKATWRSLDKDSRD